MTPLTDWAEFILQVLLLGLTRIIAVFYVKLFEGIVAKCKKDRDVRKKKI